MKKFKRPNPRRPGRRYLLMMTHPHYGFVWAAAPVLGDDFVVRLCMYPRPGERRGFFGWDPDRNRVHCESCRGLHARMRAGWFYHDWLKTKPARPLSGSHGLRLRREGRRHPGFWTSGQSKGGSR